MDCLPTLIAVQFQILPAAKEPDPPVRKTIFFAITIEPIFRILEMVTLRIPPEKAIALLLERIDDMKTLYNTPSSPGYYDVVGWMSKTYSAVDQIYEGGDIHPEEIRTIALPACSCNAEGNIQMVLEAFHSRLLQYIGEIRMSVEPHE